MSRFDIGSAITCFLAWKKSVGVIVDSVPHDTFFVVVDERTTFDYASSGTRQVVC